MRIAAALLFVALALPLTAQEMEQLLLPVEPSVMLCSRDARYETKLVVYNLGARPVPLQCAENACGTVASIAGREVEGSLDSQARPTFLYLPGNEVNNVRMALVVESSIEGHDEDHTFAELPIARASDFREGKLTLVGVRMDPGYRQALRIFGLDGGYSFVKVSAYDLKTNELLYEEPHLLYPQSYETTASGMPARPSLSIECDLSEELPDQLHGQFVRIELESLTPGLKFWSFVSLTNNKTQQFYTITPR